MVTVEDVRAIALTLPRTTEHLIRERVRFRVKSIVYAGISADESIIGFGFPKEERADLVAGEPEKFLMPMTSDLRFNWVLARMAALDLPEMRELVTDAWAMCVPKYVRAAYFESVATGVPVSVLLSSAQPAKRNSQVKPPRPPGSRSSVASPAADRPSR